MHVLQTPVRFYPHIGGVETYVHDLSKKLIELGHDVSVVCAKVNPETDHHEQIDDIDVHRFTSIGSIANTNITPALPMELYRQAQTVDVIHTHLPTPWSADLSALVGVATGTPVVLTYHNDIIGEGFANYVARLYNQTMLRATLQLVDTVVITQPDYYDDSPHLGPHQDKIEVVPNGVDVNRFRPATIDKAERNRLGFDASRPNVFFLSVLDGHHGYKGLDVLLEAISILNDRSETVPHLLVGGDGEARSQYEQQAKMLGVEDHVTFLGYVEDNDLVAYYSEADLFALPSLSSDQEGFGLVLLEALAAGTPVVTTDVVGVSDAVRDNEIGEIVPQDDPTELATTIEHLLTLEFNSDSARALCENEYSWRSSAEHLEQMYLELCH
ncbi:glycosyltransferase [Haloarcula amylolytica]|uniref:glycosyltransferase n=1 Tax=Haloarcula amylolytica TaxID=396317 RepID=UPI003C76DB9C